MSEKVYFQDWSYSKLDRKFKGKASVRANDNELVVTDYEFTFNIDFSRIETGKYLTQRDDGLSKTEIARGEYGSTIGGYGQSAKLDYQRLQVIFILFEYLIEMSIKNNVVCQCDEKNQCRWNMEVCHAFKWERYQYSYRHFFYSFSFLNPVADA